MSLLQASSHAKCILSGEHSILYKAPAAALILKNFKLHYSENCDGKSQELLINNENAAPLYKDILLKIRKSLKIADEWEKIHIQTNIPISSGLGSSAAFCNALVKAHFNKSQHQLELISQAENIIHGQSSGLDPTCIHQEKSIVYLKNHEHRSLKTQNFKDSKFSFFLTNSEEKRQSQESILKTQEKSKKELEPLSLLSETAITSFEEELHHLAESMNAIHLKLEELEKSSLKIEKIRKELLESGALAVKITGAGNGGHLLGLCSRDSTFYKHNSLHSQEKILFIDSQTI